MIEQYIFNKITADPTLQGLLDAGGGKYHLYAGSIKRGIKFTNAVTFTLLNTTDGYPAIKSQTIQFNIFSGVHMNVATIGKALSDLMNEDNLQTDGGIEMVFSIRQSETDLGYDYDEKLYQRETTYYFKIK